MFIFLKNFSWFHVCPRRLNFNLLSNLVLMTLKRSLRASRATTRLDSNLLNFGCMLFMSSVFVHSDCDIFIVKFIDYWMHRLSLVLCWQFATFKLSKFGEWLLFLNRIEKLLVWLCEWLPWGLASTRFQHIFY